MHAEAAWHQPAWPHSTSRHARESGYPLRRGPSVNRGTSGILDHPLSRMMTALFDLHPALGMTAHDALASSKHSRKIQTKYEQRQKSCRRE
jgi:hypothetical protein